MKKRMIEIHCRLLAVLAALLMSVGSPGCGGGGGAGGFAGNDGVWSGTADGRAFQFSSEFALFEGSNGEVEQISIGGESTDGIRIDAKLPPVNGAGRYPLAAALTGAPLVPLTKPGMRARVGGREYYSRMMGGASSVSAHIDSITGGREGGRLRGSLSGTLYAYDVDLQGTSFVPVWNEDSYIQVSATFDLPTHDQVAPKTPGGSGGGGASYPTTQPYGSNVARLVAAIGTTSVYDLSNRYPAVCMRDSYVVAAMTLAWGANEYWKTGQAQAAVQSATQMQQYLNQATALCSNAPGFGGGGTCSTLTVWPCP